MHLARWLIAAALLAALAAPLSGCRKYIAPPADASLTGGRGGGSGGTGGRGGAGGAGGETGGTITDADSQVDERDADRPVDGEIPDMAPACGTSKGSPCCPGNRCGGGCCYQGSCLSVGEPCPNLLPNQQGLSCFSSSCGGGCGGLLQTCCGFESYCTAPLTICIKTDASSRCESCGNTGDPCCADNYCEPPNRRCVNGRCAAM
jgi:hypothetical protein